VQIVTSSRSIGLPGTALWAVAGLLLYVLAGIAALFVIELIARVVLEPSGMMIEAGLAGLSIRNALHPVAWGLLVATAAVPIGRHLVREIRFSFAAWAVLGVGLALAALTTFLLQEFVRARYTWFDFEYAGLSIFSWPALVAIALAGWATLAVPPGRSLLLPGLAVLAVTSLAIALLPSVAGAADGIEAASIPLAAIFVVDVAYAALVGLVAIRRAAKPAAP
jgi:hypothetical protein